MMMTRVYQNCIVGNVFACAASVSAISAQAQVLGGAVSNLLNKLHT